MDDKANRKLLARNLRTEGLSYKEIANKIGVSKSVVGHWVRDIDLSGSQIERLKENEKRNRELFGKINKEIKRSKRKNIVEIEQEIQKNVILYHNSLALVGAALYWAEGSKKGFSFSNTDPVMVKLFILWCKNILGTKLSDIKCSISVYLNNKFSYQEIEDYWKELTEIPRENFRKPQINNIPKSSKQTKKNILVYGTIKLTLVKPYRYKARYTALVEKLGKETDFIRTGM